jgi:hypothetical protein
LERGVRPVKWIPIDRQLFAGDLETASIAFVDPVALKGLVIGKLDRDLARRHGSSKNVMSDEQLGIKPYRAVVEIGRAVLWAMFAVSNELDRIIIILIADEQLGPGLVLPRTPSSEIWADARARKLKLNL